MKKLWAGIAVALVVVIGAAAQDLEVALQRAVQQETVSGDLKAAIEAYRQIAETAGTNRSLAARALVRLADAYRKLGDAEARRIYERIVKDYADQKESSSAARAALSALRPAASTAQGQTAREIWSGLEVDPMGAPAADGSVLSFTDWNTGDLAVRDLATGTTRRLTNTGGWEASGDFAEFSVPSPDGREVAYAWFTNSAPISNAYDLRVVSLNNGAAKPRVVYRGTDVRWVAPCAWTRDGSGLVIMRHLFGKPVEIAVLTVATGAIRPVKALPTASQRISLSPDGRHLAYDAPRDGNVSARDVFVIGIDGRGDTPLVATTANEQLPVWSADGTQVLFLSNRTGHNSLWSLPVRDGKPAGTARIVKPDAGNMYPLGLTRSGGFYYFVGGDQHNVYTTTLGAAGEAAPASLLSERFVNSNTSGAWSPDGKSIAYYSFRGYRENQGATLIIRDIASGAERELPISMPVMRNNASVRWLADSRAILIPTREESGTAYRRIDLASGKETILVKIVGRGPGANSPAISPDGKTIFHPDPDEKGMSRSLVRVDLETGQKSVLVDGWIHAVAISPDGKRVAYVGGRGSSAGKVSEIGIVPVTGGEPQVIYRNTWIDNTRFATISWTPDGTQILFVRSGDTSIVQTLWRIPAAGGEPQKTGVTVQGVLKHPHLHPDGKRLLYSVREMDDSAVWVLENFPPPAKKGS